MTRTRDSAAGLGGKRWARDIVREFSDGTWPARSPSAMRAYRAWADPLVWYEASGRTGALDASQPGEHRHTVRISRTIAARLAADQKTREASEWARRLVKAEAKAKKLRRHIATLRGIVKRNESRTEVPK